MKKSSKIIRLLCAGAGVAMSLVAATTTVQAADVKVVPGTTCGASASGTTGLTAFFTALVNVSGQPATVNCPLLRDVHDTITGLVDLDVVVSSSSSVSCTAVSVSSFNGILRSVNGTTAPNSNVIDFGAGLFFSGEVSNGTGTLTRGSTNAVLCTLPASSTIQAIRYDE